MSSAMDLVAEYISDAEIEEVKSSSTKKVDFIDIADSDAEDCPSSDGNLGTKSDCSSSEGKLDIKSDCPSSDGKLDIKSDCSSSDGKLDIKSDCPSSDGKLDVKSDCPSSDGKLDVKSDCPSSDGKLDVKSDCPSSDGKLDVKSDCPSSDGKLDVKSDCPSSDGKLDIKSEAASDQETDTPTVVMETDCIESEAKDKDSVCSMKENVDNIAITDNTCTNIGETSAQETDYLNLNGSDSDIEEQETPSKVEQLLSSATELSNTPCGPAKPSDEDEMCMPLAGELSTVKVKEETNIVDSLSEETSSSVDIKPDLEALQWELEHNMSEIVYESESVSEPSSKRLKYNDDSDTDAGGDMSQAETNIYRRDGRVNRGYYKTLLCCIPKIMKKTFVGHANVVTTMDWCTPYYSHLLLSASADCTLKIWDMYRTKPVRQFEDSSGLKAAKWSIDGELVIFGGYGKKAHVFDVLSGREIYTYDVYNDVISIQIHPEYSDIFLCGTRNTILAFDLRVNSTLPVRTFFSKCEEVLDIQFLNKDEFVCSTSVVTRDSADRTIMAWDFPSGAILSNQIYLERYTCPTLKVHPYDMTFLAQTNGDYIASFSTNRPYRRRSRRYMGHKVSGFGIDCEVSPDGKYVASGDANGDIYFYNYVTTEVLKVIPAKPHVAVNRIRWHPFFSSIVATATWDGHMQIWK